MPLNRAFEISAGEDAAVQSAGVGADQGLLNAVKLSCLLCLLIPQGGRGNSFSAQKCPADAVGGLILYDHQFILIRGGHGDLQMRVFAVAQHMTALFI